MEDYYLIAKSVHLISIIAWMAGLFYLPRLFVYHCENSSNTQMAQVFQIMERRLYNIIMMPAMILSLASGGFLAIVRGEWSSGWMHLKLMSVLALVVFHFLLNHWRGLLATGLCTQGSKFFRLVNEIPTILLIIIVVSVVFKPF